MSLVAPFRYSALLFAVVLGFVVWGEFPNAVAWLGITLLIASGVLVLRRERPGRLVAPATTAPRAVGTVGSRPPP